MSTLSTAARDAACNAITALIDAGAGAGKIVFQLAAGTAVATVTFSTTAFGASGAVNPGECIAATMTDDSNAVGNASPVTKASLQDSNGVEVLVATVGTSGSDINLSSTSISAGDGVSLSSLSITVPA